MVLRPIELGQDQSSTSLIHGPPGPGVGVGDVNTSNDENPDHLANSWR